MVRGAGRNDSIQTAAVPDFALISIFHPPHVSERREFNAIASYDDRMMCSLYQDELDHLGLGMYKMCRIVHHIDGTGICITNS